MFRHEMKHHLVLVLTVLSAALTPRPSLATEGSATEGRFVGLDYAGDGKTPSLLDHLTQHTPAVQAGPGGATVGAGGEAHYRVPISLPPALLAPDLALTYQSSAGVLTDLARGWSIQSGMHLSLPPLRHRLRAYADTEVVKVSGGGLSGLFEPVDDGHWRYVSTAGAQAKAWYDGTTRSWTVKAGGVTTTLAARDDVDE